MKMTRCLAWSLILLLAAATVNAAPWDKSARIERAVKKYNTDKVETIYGTVTKIYEKVPSFGKKKKDALGFHVVIKGETEKVDIHLGPTWYLKSLDDRIAVGDLIVATGSTKAAEEKDGKMKPKQMRASEIKKSGIVVMKLRDEQGRPLWSGTVFSQPSPPALTETTESTSEASTQSNL